MLPSLGSLLLRAGDARRTCSLAALAAAWLASAAAAQPVLITSPTVISPADTTITSTDGGPAVPLSTAFITVQGTTLTINGRHTVASLTLERSGTFPAIVTHSPNTSFDYSGNGTDVVYGMDLSVTGYLELQAADGALLASRIDASGRGYPATQGPGAGTSSFNGACGSAGGGHGGSGGTTPCGYLGGATYGSITQPTLFGSGSGTFITGLGAAGGGAIRITAGAINLGTGAFISADGQGANGVGGAGGSVWIDCFTLAGAGTISANGGNAAGIAYGGGGGGRIAVTYLSSTLTGSIQARGGTGSRGGAGTVFTKQSGQRGTVTIDNGIAPAGETTAMSGLQSIDADLVVSNYAVLGPPRGDDTLHLSVTGDVTVGPNGAVSADARGYSQTQGPGAGTSSVDGACGPAGGSHGGSGGLGNPCGYLGGPTYGSITQPTTKGSGSGTYVNGLGASGGGVIRLTVGGTLSIDPEGLVSANGQSANSAAGAGGSLWLTCGSLAGGGAIAANGGNAANGSWGGGGGGRIALYYGSSTFAGSMQAFGGTGSRAGAGTIFTKPASGRGTLTIDNGFAPAGETTAMSGLQSLDANLVVANYAVLGPPRGDDTLHLSFTGDVTVGPFGVIGADGRGFTQTQGPGAGASSFNGACGPAGGSHGGAGGTGNSCGYLGGSTYGSITQPTTKGSGSGTYVNGLGASGGGVIRLSAGRTLSIDPAGLISANGQSANSAAGAGGSLWLTCDTLAGSGAIQTNGGNGANGSWGGGGGGRIAIYYNDASTFAGVMQSYGGTGSRAGAGTIYVKASDVLGAITVDNGFAPFGEVTELSGYQQLNADLRVANFAVLGPPRADASLFLDLAGNITVDANGVIGAPSRGYPATQGPGAGESSVNAACGPAGGGHGGKGGDGGNCGFIGGATYDSAERPADMGSGSGTYVNGLGAAGGGVIRVFSPGTIDVRAGGLISVNGQSNQAAGAGGGIWLTCAALQGDGFITADGGSGANSSWGAGGGGRIAIYACVSSMSAANIHANAGLFGRPAEAGSVLISAARASVEPEIACYASEVTFRVTSSGQVNSYQWRFNGQAIDDGPLPSGAVVMGATTNTLVITGVTSLEEGDYDCEIPDACGGVTSNATHLFVTCCPDVNQDGSVDQGDVDYIINVVAGGDNPTGIDPDFNHDGNADQSDVDALINVVAGGGCP